MSLQYTCSDITGTSGKYRRFTRFTLGLCAMAFLAAPAELRARDIMSIIMPGEVISGHAKYERECTRCHEPFSKESQQRLCLDCHKKVAEDIEKVVGYHGLNKNIKGKECKHCHPEHKGRDFDAVLLDREVFDHTLTDFKLKGGHIKVKCSGCHEPKVKYRDAKSTCQECHKKNEPHRGRLGEKCSDCHEEQTWKKTRYDHNKTKFPLKEKHMKVACNSCHPNQRYKKTPLNCKTCHALNNVHGNRYEKKCETCHTPKDWKKPYYDHAKTKFPLKEKHRNVSCHQCHKDKTYKDKREATCYSCHKNDDRHKGRYDTKCETCHTPKEWKTYTYDHNKTKLPLKDKHVDVHCDACHRRPITGKKLGTNCVNCHHLNDVHKGQEGNMCERCHNERGWGIEVFFDHDLTSFPLIGLHAITPCEECHLSGTYKDTKMNCLGCHRPDDQHKQRLGPDCGYCHNPNGWRLWEFDHNTQTKYRLEGKHEGMECLSCHREPAKNKNIRLDRKCRSCHLSEDVHRGGFGNHCEWCHSTGSFKKVRFIDDPSSKEGSLGTPHSESLEDSSNAEEVLQ